MVPMRAFLCANVRRKSVVNNIVASKLRDKVAANCHIHMGFHPIDCHRANSTKMTRLPTAGPEGRPAVRLDGVATKRPGQLVRNYFVCGCPIGQPHNPNNDMCELALVDHLVESLGEDRANVTLFWAHTDRGMKWQDRRQKKDTLSKSLNRINRVMGIRPGENLTGSMGRKTFVTLGQMFFHFPKELQKAATHHLADTNFQTYIDPGYVNIG